MALLINGGGGRNTLNLEIAVDKRDKPGIQAKLLILQNINKPTC